MSARPLPCKTVGCPGVLGWVQDGVLTTAPDVRVAMLPATGRCTVTCPVCGAANDRHGGAVIVPARRSLAA